MGHAITIKRNIQRPDAATVALFKGVQTGYISDARGRKGALDYSIRPLTTSCTFFGTAVTISCRPRDNLLCWAALDVAQAGDVLVISNGGATDVSVVGDLFLGMARNKGIVAVITDGLARDIEGMNEVGLPVFAQGLSPNAPFKDGSGEIGLPIVIGKVGISSGDIVVGDANGLVVVPVSEIRATLDGVASVRQKEAVVEAAIKAGAARPAWLDETLKAKGVLYLD